MQWKDIHRENAQLERGFTLVSKKKVQTMCTFANVKTRLELGERKKELKENKEPHPFFLPKLWRQQMIFFPFTTDQR